MDGLKVILRTPSRCAVHFCPGDALGSVLSDLEAEGFLVRTIDLTHVTDIGTLVEALKLSIEIPAYTGHNLDALDDSLTDVPEGYNGYILLAYGSRMFWLGYPDLALNFSSCWRYGADFWHRSERPFHLIFVEG
jgi:hypothetical protein